MTRYGVYFLLGVLLCAGLMLGSLTRADVILGLFDLQAWDPTLVIFFVGAVPSYMLLATLEQGLSVPKMGSSFDRAVLAGIDRRLVLGAALFGVGWGLAGTCPGPGIIALATVSVPAAVFFGAMVAGMWLHRLWNPARGS